MNTFKTLALFSLSLGSVQAFAQQNSEIFQSDTVYRIDQHIDTTTMNPLRLPAGKPLRTTRIVKVRGRTYQYMSETAGVIRDHHFAPLRTGDKGSAATDSWQPNIALQVASRYTFHRIHQYSGYSTCLYLEPSEENQPRRYILLETPFLAKIAAPADLDRHFPMQTSERETLENLRRAVRRMPQSRATKTTPDRTISDNDPVAVPDNTPARDDKVFTYVEEMPEFPGGLEKLKEYIRTQLRYPVQDTVTGTVAVRFTVRHNGQPSDFQIIRHLSPACDREALRLLKNMPNWKPGKQNGKPANVSFTLPVRFNPSEKR